MRGTERLQALLTLALLVPVQTAAQQSLHVVTATGPISLDGRLGGPAWAGADSITDFRQREPAAGGPPRAGRAGKAVRARPAADGAPRAPEGGKRDAPGGGLRPGAGRSRDDNR